MTARRLFRDDEAQAVLGGATTFSRARFTL